MRLIDADDLINRYCAENCGCVRSDCNLTYAEDGCEGCVFVNEIENAPTVEAEPVRHGRWIGEGDGYSDGYPVFDIWYCSECEYCIDDGTDDPSLLPEYCQNCGAKMDGGNDG